MEFLLPLFSFTRISNDAHHQAASTVDEVMEDVSIQLAAISQGPVPTGTAVLPTLRSYSRDLGSNPCPRFIFLPDDLCQRRLRRF